VRRAAHQILSRPQFVPTPETPIERLRRWVFNELGTLINGIVHAGPGGLLGLLLTLAVAIGLVALIVRAVVATSPNPVHARRFSVSGPRRSAADWSAEATRCEAAGDWRGALRSRYRALIAELARQGLVEEIDGRTTGEYERAVAGALPAQAREFAGATELFERAWYGDAPTDAAMAAEFRLLAQRVLVGIR